MAHKIVSYEIVQNGPQEQVEIETTGDLKYMPRNAQLVMATYGTYERTGNGTLLYSAGIAREKDGSLSHDYDTEYGDDLVSLKNGRIQVLY